MTSKLIEALKDTAAHLAAAISLLERSPKKAAPSDKMFDQMLIDYRASLERARAALAEAATPPQVNGEDVWLRYALGRIQYVSTGGTPGYNLQGRLDHCGRIAADALSGLSEGKEGGSSSASLPAHVGKPTATEAQHSDGWRDIATAPKDGTIIDVWRPEAGRDTVFWGYPHHECGEMGGLCDSDWHRIRAPGWVCNTFGEFLGRKHAPFTHWKPLPSAPSSEAQSQRDGGATARPVALSEHDALNPHPSEGEGRQTEGAEPVAADGSETGIEP